MRIQRKAVNGERSAVSVLLLLSVLLLTAFAATATPEFRVLSSSATHLQVQVALPESGTAARLIAVPPGTLPQVTITSAQTQDSAPVSRSVIVTLGKPVQMRDIRLVPVIVHNPQSSISGLQSAICNLSISIPPGRIAPRKVPAGFAQLYRSIALNPLDIEPGAPEGMLIIVPDAYYSNALALARWKELKGYYVTLKRKSEVGSDQTQIRDYILNAWQTWPVPPEYVLLCGTIDQIPAFTIRTAGVVTDHDYACLDGDDYFPEVFVGRLPANSGPMLDYLTQKIIAYEKTPDESDTTWFRRAVMVATLYQEGGTPAITAIECKRWIREFLLGRGLSEVDTVFDPPYHVRGDGSVAAIDSAVNRGAAFVNGRGWGNSGGWNYPEYRTADVASLANGWRLPVVTSLYCGTGAFNANPCFGEELLQAGSPSQPRGAVAFFGPSWLSTSTRWNNCLDFGIYWGIFSERITTLGAALVRGKFEVWNNFPMPCDTFVQRVYWYTYGLLGDPSLQLWAGAAPQHFTVNLPASIPVGASLLPVHASPGSSALVALLQGSNLVTALTDNGGDANVAIPPLTAETLFVTVTKPGFVPYCSYLIPGSQPLFVGYNSHTAGSINPGATVNVSVELKNFGTSQTAAGVTGVLRSTDPYVALLDTTSAYGDIVPGGTASGTPYMFSVSGSCPNGHVLHFEIAVTSGADEWTSGLDLTVSSGQLAYVAHSGDPVPGQSADIVVTLTNQGALALSNVTGTLVSHSDAMTVEDAGGTFGTMNPGDTATNAADVFRVHTRSECADGRRIGFDLLLAAGGGIVQTVHFDIQAGIPTATAPLGPDAYGYWAYDDVDVSYLRHPSYSWYEIDPNYGGSGTRLDLHDNETRVVPIPFVFRYYGADYRRISICDNGFLTCDSTSEHSFYNWRIPCAYGPPNIIAPFWDDFRPDTAGASGVYYYNDAVNHRFVVEWSRVHHIHGFRPPILAELQTFEAILNDPAYHPTRTGDGEIVFQYDTVYNDDSISLNCHNRASVGIANRDQNVGLQCMFADSLSPACAEITMGRAIKFTTDPPDTFSGIGNQALTPDSRPPTPFLRVLPTVGRSRFRVNYALPTGGSGMLRLLDVNGRVRRTWHVRESGSLDMGFGTPDLPDGVYMLSLTLKNETRIMMLERKLVVH